MAEGGNLTEVEADNDLTCSVCMDTYKKPKVLPCLHSFCKACLESIVLLEQDKQKPSRSKSTILGDSLPVESLPNLTEGCGIQDGLTPLDLSYEPATRELDLEIPEQGALIEPTDLPEADIEFSVPHTFSAGIESFVQETIITCPICKAKHPVPEGKVEELPDDYEALDRLESNSIKQSLIKKELKCIQCGSEEGVLNYCLDCSGALCEFCVKAHKRQKIFNDHSVMPNDNLSPEQFVSPKKTKICKRHNEAFVFFCNDCKQLICPICLASTPGHREHDYITPDKADKSCLEEVQKLVRVSEKNLRTFHGHKDYLQGIEKAVVMSNHTDQLMKRINREFDACIQTLQERRGYLLAEAEKVGTMSKKDVWSEKEVVERTITKIQSGVTFAQRAQKCSNLEERIVMNTQAISRLGEVFEASWDRGAIQAPLVFTLSTQQPSIDSLASWGKLSLLSDEDISLEDESGATTVWQPSLVTVKFRIDTLSSPSFQILYGKSQQILDIVAYDSEEDINCYNVEFVPRVAGSHVLEIWLAGVSVGRKVFSVAGRPRVGNRVQIGPDCVADCETREHC